MSYTALYRKWRPKVWEDLIGQTAIVDTLRSQIQRGNIGHAYIFSGTRGTGKTSTAKILARAINCPNRVSNNPCNQCEICKSILEESLMDVMEIDAASNNGVDDIRELRENVKYPPSKSAYKVYIIDEVHMLSTSAFNALLKTLEEPPAYAVFILATTEPHKIPATIQSRCQQFEFKRVGRDELMVRMRMICLEQGLTCEDEALDKLIGRSDGAVRDALSLLDRCLSTSSDFLSAKDVDRVLGLVDVDFVLTIIDQIGQRDRVNVLKSLNSVSESGTNLQAFCKDLSHAFRDVMVLAAAPGHLELLNYSGQAPERAAAQAKIFGLNGAIKLLEALAQIELQIKYSRNPLIVIEAGILKAMTPTSISSSEAIERLERLEKLVAVGKVELNDFEKNNSDYAGKAIEDLATYKIAFPNREKDENNAIRSITNHESAPEKTAHEISKPTTNNDAVQFDPELPLRLWPEILSYLQKSNGRIYAFLVDGTPLKVDRGQLVVGFKNKDDIQVAKLKEPANQKCVEDAFETVIGHALGFKLEIMTEHNSPVTENSTEDRIRSLLGDMANLLEISDK